MSTESDLQALTKVVYGEARGESDEGKRAVAHVVINRTKKSGKSIQYECSKKGQFYGYTAAGSMSDAKAKEACQKIAQDAINGTSSDPTNGATFFFSGSKVPNWASGKQPCATIGGHKFYKGIAPY